MMMMMMMMMIAYLSTVILGHNAASQDFCSVSHTQTHLSDTYIYNPPNGKVQILSALC